MVHRVGIGVAVGCLGVIALCVAAWSISLYDYPEDQEVSCEGRNIFSPRPQVGSPCAEWQTTGRNQGQCRKGTWQEDGADLICNAKSHPLPLILMIAGGVLLLAGCCLCICGADEKPQAQAQAQAQAQG